MCIRDRAYRAACRRLPVRQILINEFAVRVSVKPATARRRNCLLYTSDAADERSSVDLGGRRIIKKKKHETNK